MFDLGSSSNRILPVLFRMSELQMVMTMTDLQPLNVVQLLRRVLTLVRNAIRNQFATLGNSTKALLHKMSIALLHSSHLPIHPPSCHVLSGRL